MHENFDTGEVKFTFADFSDLEGDNRSRVFDIAIAQLSLLNPELIINVGDLIAGPSNSPQELHALWDTFDERTAKAQAPVFYVGGNHDVGNDNISGATSVQGSARLNWENFYPESFFELDNKDKK